MSAILNFFKGIFMLNEAETVPIGLCGFDCPPQQTATKKSKPKRKREMRLSELMDNNIVE